MRTMLIAVVTVLGVGAAVLGPAAVAAPTTSPFAGEYSGPTYATGEQSTFDWGTISISSSGRITGLDPSFGRGKFTGIVGADGTYSVSGSILYRLPRNWVRDTRAAEASAIAESYPFTSTGTFALGADGNLQGTTTSGATFVWTRK